MEPALQPLIDRIRAAQAGGMPLRIRGGGTKDFLGPWIDGELLDTRALAGVVSYEPSELVVTVRAGEPLAALETLLAGCGQSLPFEPPHFGPGATVGGMVAAGLSGPARASAGSVRDYVLGARIVNGRGELLTFGGQVMKNVAGYDLSRLMAGSLGTLGLIAEVSLKVLPLAPAEVTLGFAMDADAALRALNTWGGQPLPLNASCWTVESGQGVLWLRLRGAVAAVDAACRKLGGERLGTAQASAFWQSLREQTHPFFAAAAADQGLWRLSVAQAAPPLPLPQPQLVEWHGGQRWLHAPVDAAPALRAAAQQAGGHATLFRRPAHAAGAHGVAVFTPPAAPLDRIQRELMKQFDPAGIFQPGRLLAPSSAAAVSG